MQLVKGLEVHTIEPSVFSHVFKINWAHYDGRAKYLSRGGSGLSHK